MIRNHQVRAVSLVPSITESLRAWGVDPIACTRYCEQPDLHHVGGTKNPDIDAIVALAPDVVLVDKVENRREDAEAMEARGLRVVAVDVRTLADVAGEMALIAREVGVDVSGIETETEAASTVLGSKRAFVPIWRRPWMTIGPETYGSTLLEAIGIENVFGDAPLDFPKTTLEEVAERRPDVVLVPSEPYEFSDEHLAELAPIAPVVRVDGRDLFWWGVRTPDAIRRLRKQL